MHARHRSKAFFSSPRTFPVTTPTAMTAAPAANRTARTAVLSLASFSICSRLPSYICARMYCFTPSRVLFSQAFSFSSSAILQMI